jgi:hypothetical protein
MQQSALERPQLEAGEPIFDDGVCVRHRGASIRKTSL